MWSVAKHREEWVKAAQRRAVPVVHDLELTEAPLPLPRRGTDTESPLVHWHRGLVGAFQDWAKGSLRNIIKRLLMVCKCSSITGHVAKELASLRYPIRDIANTCKTTKWIGIVMQDQQSDAR
eukprot:1886606-Pleurochrysis_carterae.AAC.10